MKTPPFQRARRECCVNQKDIQLLGRKQRRLESYPESNEGPSPIPSAFCTCFLTQLNGFKLRGPVIKIKPYALVSGILILGLFGPNIASDQPKANASAKYDTLVQNLTGWKVRQTSPDLSQKTFIENWVKAHQQNLTAANCTGFFAPGTKSKEIEVLRKRAKATCDEIKKNASWASVSSRVASTRFKSLIGQTNVRLTVAKTADGTTPTPTPSPTSEASDQLSGEFGFSKTSSIDKCKITSTGSGWNTVGFPINLRMGGRESYKTLPSTGIIKALVIVVDFPNYPGIANPASYVAAVTKKNNDFFRAMSYGAVEFNYTVLPQHVRMSRNAEDYGIGTWGVGDYSIYYREALDNAARAFDISGYDVAFVLASAATPARAITPGPAFPAPYMTIDGAIPLGTATGGMPDSEQAFRWMAHETGHLFGWVDLYDVSGRDDPANGRHSRFGWWDIMSMNWETFNLELNAWFRFQVGWIPDRDIVCFEIANLKQAEVQITNLSANQGRRMIVIRVSDQKAIVMERRSITEYAPMLGDPSKAGVIVYEVDGAKDFQMAPVTIARKSSFLVDGPLSRAALRQGEFVDVANLRISVSSQGTDNSRVVISTR